MQFNKCPENKKCVFAWLKTTRCSLGLARRSRKKRKEKSWDRRRTLVQCCSLGVVFQVPHLGSTVGAFTHIIRVRTGCWTTPSSATQRPQPVPRGCYAVRCISQAQLPTNPSPYANPKPAKTHPKPESIFTCTRITCDAVAQRAYRFDRLLVRSGTCAFFLAISMFSPGKPKFVKNLGPTAFQSSLADL